MIHAEKNALSNCIVRPDGATAYVTGQCCNDCIMSLWQEGVTRVIMADNHGTKLFDDEAKKRNERTRMKETKTFSSSSPPPHIILPLLLIAQ